MVGLLNILLSVCVIYMMQTDIQVIQFSYDKNRDGSWNIRLCSTILRSCEPEKVLLNVYFLSTHWNYTHLTLAFPFPSDISMSPIMGIRRIASRDRLKMLSPGSLFNPDGSIVPVSVANAEAFQSNSDRIKRVSSSSSISSLGMIL